MPNPRIYNVWLCAALPKRGLAYLPPARILKRSTEQELKREFIAHGMPAFQPAHLEATLVALFEDLAPLAAAAEPQQFGGVMMDLARHHPWVGSTRTPALLDLIGTLFEARVRWLEDPRPPFNMAEHWALAHAIDGMRELVGDDWTEGLEELLLITGGFTGYDVSCDYDDDEEGKKKDEEEENGGAPLAFHHHHLVLLPSRPVENGEEEKEEDTEMGGI